ncbi:MAG: hypothetical protein ACYDDG_09235 [Casimicrobiaceae bacterium]
MLPFQAALGAAAAPCLQTAHHSAGTRAALHSGPLVDRSLVSEDRNLPSAGNADAQLPAIGNPDVHRLAAGPCGNCGTCCFNEVAISEPLPVASIAGAGSRATASVDIANASGAVDDLFRPPRSASL